MTEAAKAARRAYKREWAKRNPDKIKAAQERHWEKKAAAQREQVNKPATAPADIPRGENNGEKY